MLALVLAVSLCAEPGAEAPAEPPVSSARRPVVLAGVLGGVALLGAGVGLRLASGGIYDRIYRGYPAFSGYDEVTAARRTGELEQTLALGFLIGGVAVLALTAVLSLFP